MSPDADPASGLADDPELRVVLAKLGIVPGRTFEITELGGGLTNRNYRVRTTDALTGDADADADADADYVLRLSTNSSGLLAIDRARERTNTARAFEAGVGAPVIAAFPEHNVLVVGFLPGRTFGKEDVRDPVTIPRIAAAVRMLHAGPAFDGVFDMRTIRRQYLDIVSSRGFRLPDDYFELERRIVSVEEAMAPRPEVLVPCNNDLLAGNFIDDGSAVHIIDYEYSGMNEASFELGNLASESGLDAAATAALVREYWQSESTHKLARARAWSMLARYGWTLWASIQASVSTIDFDFWEWGMEKYDSVRDELAGPAFGEVLAGLGADD